MASIKELEVEISKLRKRLDDIGKPNPEYIVNLEASLDKIKARILSLSTVAAEAKAAITQIKTDSINTLLSFKDEVVRVTELRDAFHPPVFDVVPSVTTAKIQIQKTNKAVGFKISLVEDVTKQTSELVTHRLTLTIPGLQPSTKYNIYIRSIDDIGNESVVSEIQSFETLKLN